MTLLQWAESLVSEKEDKIKGVEHIKKVLKMKGYKPWIFNTMQPKRNHENINTKETNRRQHATGLPYRHSAIALCRDPSTHHSDG